MSPGSRKAQTSSTRPPVHQVSDHKCGLLKGGDQAKVEVVVGGPLHDLVKEAQCELSVPVQQVHTEEVTQHVLLDRGVRSEDPLEDVQETLLMLKTGRAHPEGSSSHAFPTGI